MDAHIRLSTPKEYPRLIRPVVCVVDNRIHFAYDSWRREIHEIASDIKVRPTGSFVALRYEFPNGEELVVTTEFGSWVFDGKRVRETWPTPLQRVMVCGERNYRVKPEDDTLFFATGGKGPDWVATLIGFHVYLGTGGGSD
jgi:hypothetical protein